MNSSKKTVCLVLLVACAILWFFAPYIRFILDISAFKAVSEASKAGVLFRIETTEAFFELCAILGPIVGIVICAITTLTGSRTATGVVGILTEIPMVIYLVYLFKEISELGGNTLKILFDFMGYGFWGILVLMAVVIVLCFSGKKNA